MEKILENIWVLFIGIGSWMANRLAQKIDNLEKGKADSEALGQQSKLIHELDRRVDELGHTTINRAEFKQDVISLHTRINEQEQRKADRVQQIRVVDDKKGK
tara:strand:- start:67 stop:372 length:306 start_codon:yes stop_codon:yes gene_type:complete